MKFTFNGAKYEIEFFRQRKHKDTVEKGIAPSRITTVRIYKSKPDSLPGELILEASSTCAVVDNFVAETGRIKALREATRSLTLSPAFKVAMWNAYINRPRPKSVPKVNVEESIRTKEGN